MSANLIIGGDSTIGAALAAKLGCAFTSRRQGATLHFDLAQSPSTWPALPKADVAYICAAITKLDVCENDPEATRLVNVTHTQALIERLQSQGSFVVFISSNQVFDGSIAFAKTTDPTSAKNEYGSQKAALEAWLLARPKPAAVLRLTKVISSPLPIIAEWKQAIANNETIDAFDDLIFAPLPLDAALQALEIIGKEKRAGISQLSGIRDISYADIARKLTNKVNPISATSKGILKNFLPKHGTLASTFSEISIPEPEQILLPS